MTFNLRVILSAMLLVAAGGCVTINIYFPAAAAEKAADRIIDEVWQLREGQRSPSGPAGSPAPAKEPSEGARP